MYAQDISNSRTDGFAGMEAKGLDLLFNIHSRLVQLVEHPKVFLRSKHIDDVIRNHVALQGRQSLDTEDVALFQVINTTLVVFVRSFTTNSFTTFLQELTERDFVHQNCTARQLELLEGVADINQRNTSHRTRNERVLYCT